MKSIYYIGCTLLCLTLFSCGEDEMPTDPVQPELITTLIYSLESSDGEIVNLEFQDIDGDGGNTPTITGGTLKTGETYNGTITLSNESVSPTEDITAEVREEADEHQFFFSNTFGSTISYVDTDDNGKPLGLLSNLTTPMDSATGNLTITLRHEPNKSGNNVEQGDITNAGGETDIEVSFPIIIE